MSGRDESFDGQWNAAAARKIAESFGIPPSQAQIVVDTIAPEFTQAIEQLTLSRGGVSDLLDAIGRHTNLENDSAGSRAPDAEPGLKLDSPSVRAEGDRLLEYMFDSKYKSRTLAQSVSRKTDLDAGQLKNILPALANEYFGRLGQATGQDLGQLGQAITADDKFAGQEPLGIPDGDFRRTGRQNSGPYGDLSDIIRRGGRPGSGGPSGGNLWSIVRNMIGSALGFQNRGIVGWIIQLIIYRWGWSILKTVLSRVFFGR